MSFDVQKVVKVVEPILKPLWIKFKSFNPIVRWSTYILGFFGLNGLYNFLLRKINKYPPGNYGLPIFGNVFALLHVADSKYIANLRKYDKTATMIYTGMLPQIIIHDLDIAKEVFVKDSKSRALLSNKYLSVNWDGYAPFGDVNGYEWKYRRQLTHKSLSVLIDSKYIDTRMHSLISNTLYPILDEYSSTKKEYYFRIDLKYSMFQFLFVAFFGNNVEIPKKDGEYKTFLRLNEIFWSKWINLVMVGLFIGPNNKVGRYLHNKIDYQNQLMMQTRKFFTKYVQIYKENTKNNDNNADCYLERQLQHQKTYDTFDDKKLVNDMFSSFITGFHITLGEIETVLYYAAKNVSQQELVYNELKEYYKNKPNGFEVKDTKNLHYFRAFVYEVLRYNGVVTLNFDRYTTKKVKIGPYYAPKKALIKYNIIGIHFNPKYFGDDCDTFNMKRWLNNENKFEMNPAFVLFGLGPRNCPGQSLALREVFSVLAPLLFRYKFTKPDNMTTYDVTDNWFQPNVPQLPLILTKR